VARPAKGWFLVAEWEQDKIPLSIAVYVTIGDGLPATLRPRELSAELEQAIWHTVRLIHQTVTGSEEQSSSNMFESSQYPSVTVELRNHGDLTEHQANPTPTIKTSKRDMRGRGAEQQALSTPE